MVQSMVQLRLVPERPRLPAPLLAVAAAAGAQAQQAYAASAFARRVALAREEIPEEFEAGKSLDEVHAIAERFNRNMATLAVAMKGATHPSTGAKLFELADDQMEIGMGQHGEAGTGPCKLLSADETAALMMERLLHRFEGLVFPFTNPNRHQRATAELHHLANVGEIDVDQAGLSD